MNLDEKISKAINFLKKAEKLALMMQPKHGFWLCYSGGKDSDVILKLAKMSGVKFVAYYNVTTIDPPELVRYIMLKHPEVIRIHPQYTFFDIIKKYKMLPTRTRRFCCSELKENTAAGFCAITGVRAQESTRRAKQAAEVKIQNRKGIIKKDLDSMQKTRFECVGGKDKVIINPIIDWTEKDIWNFIRKYKIDYCELYDKGFKRIGCLFCPMANNKLRNKQRLIYKGYYKNLLKATENFYNKKNNFKSASDMLDWWFSNKSIKKWQAENYQQFKINFDN